VFLWHVFFSLVCARSSTLRTRAPTNADDIRPAPGDDGRQRTLERRRQQSRHSKPTNIFQRQALWSGLNSLLPAAASPSSSSSSSKQQHLRRKL
jgi:hypothetical protein